MHCTARRQSAFTLIEVLAVIAIVVIVAGIVIGGAGAANRKAAEAKARSEISKFEIAVQQYKRDHGYLPSDDFDSVTDDHEITRSFLVSSDGEERYLKLNLDELRFSGNYWRDPFGQPYRYEMPGSKNPESYDVWSLGADGDDDTADDIGNFSADE